MRASSSRLRCARLPVPRQQFVNALGGVIRQAGQDVGKPRIDVIELGGGDEAVDGGRTPAVVGAGMLASDANQGWSVDQALVMLPRLAAFDLRWLEEPIRADRPREEWRRLRGAAKMPIAAGENISSVDGIKEVLAEDILGVVSPISRHRAGLASVLGWPVTSSRWARHSVRIIWAAASGGTRTHLQGPQQLSFSAMNAARTLSPPFGGYFVLWRQHGAQASGRVRSHEILDCPQGCPALNALLCSD